MEYRRDTYLGAMQVDGFRRIFIKHDGNDKTEAPLVVGYLGPRGDVMPALGAEPFRIQITADVRELLAQPDS